MPTIEDLAPATASSDTDEMIASQNGVAVRVTRAQVVAGLQPELAVPSGSVLGRQSSGTGAPETLVLGANLLLNGGTLSATTTFEVSVLPTGTVPAASDLVAMGQNGVNTAVPFGQFMSGLPGVSGVDGSQVLVTPTGATRSQKLADMAAGMLPIVGGTMTGPLTLAANPTTALQAAPKQYVDAQSAAALPKAGGTMTGTLTLAGDPSSALQASTKQYVDTEVGTAVPKAGGSMTGPLTLASDPVASSQAATKHYVDSQVMTAVPLAGGTMTGKLTLASDPTSSLHAATKHYVDTSASTSLPLAGGTLTGPLTLVADPTASMQAATKHYVDASAASTLSTSGGTLTGPLLLSGSPSVAMQAATKGYVDAQVETSLPLAGGTLTGPLALGANRLSGSAIAVTGGTLDDVTVGGTTAAALHGTTLGLSGSATFGGNLTFSQLSTTIASQNISFSTGSSNTVTFGVTSGGSGYGITVNNQSLFLGAITADKGATISLSLTAENLSSVWSGSMATPVFESYVVASGTTTSGYPYLNSFNITDDIDGSGLAYTPVTGINLLHNYGGGTTKGGRKGFAIAIVQQNGANADTGADNYYTAASFQAHARYTQPGSATTDPIGRVFGFNAFGQIDAGYTATNYYQVASAEFNVGISAGSSAAIRSGITIADLAGAEQGFRSDQMLWLYGAGEPWRYGVCFGDVQPWPMDAAYGTMIGANAGTPAYSSRPLQTKWGIDFQQVMFPSDGNPYDGGFLRSNGFTVDGAGTVQQGSCYQGSSPNGLAIDCRGSYGVSATIATPGTGYTPGTSTLVATAYGGVWLLNVSSGGIPSAVNQLVAPVFSTTSVPANPITPTILNKSEAGSGLTLNILWKTNANQLSLNPSGGPTIVGGTLARLSMGSSTPSSGATVSIAAGVSDYRILGSAVLASLTIELPPQPVNGQIIRVSSQVGISALAVRDGVGGSADVQTPPAAMNAGSAFSAQWNATSSAWWCCIGA